MMAEAEIGVMFFDERGRGHKPRNVHRQPREAGKCRETDFEFLISRTVNKQISVVLS